MTGKDMVRHLKALGRELARDGVTGEIALAGGAVMLLVVRSRDITRDIDAYLSGDAAAIGEAGRVARRESLPPDWLNDAVKGFFYGTPPQLLWAEYPGLRVYAIRPDYIFVMKAMAGRPRDVEDLRALKNYLELPTAEDALDLISRYIPEEQVPVRVRFLVEDLWQTPEDRSDEP